MQEGGGEKGAGGSRKPGAGGSGPPRSGAVGSQTGSLGSAPTPTRATAASARSPPLPRGRRRISPFTMQPPSWNAALPACCGIPPRVAFQAPGGGESAGGRPGDRETGFLLARAECGSSQGIPRSPGGGGGGAAQVPGCVTQRILGWEGEEGQGSGPDPFAPPPSRRSGAGCLGAPAGWGQRGNPEGSQRRENPPCAPWLARIPRGSAQELMSSSLRTRGLEKRLGWARGNPLLCVSAGDLGQFCFFVFVFTSVLPGSR